MAIDKINSSHTVPKREKTEEIKEGWAYSLMPKKMQNVIAGVKSIGKTLNDFSTTAFDKKSVHAVRVGLFIAGSLCSLLLGAPGPAVLIVVATLLYGGKIVQSLAKITDILKGKGRYALYDADQKMKALKSTIKELLKPGLMLGVSLVLPVGFLVTGLVLSSIGTDMWKKVAGDERNLARKFTDTLCSKAKSLSKFVSGDRKNVAEDMYDDFISATEGALSAAVDKKIRLPGWDVIEKN